MRTLVVVAIVGWQLASTSPARAQRSDDRQTTEAGDKSPWIATGLAVGVSFGGLGIGVLADCYAPSPASWVGLSVGYASMIAGPSAGHWYAGETGHALRWTAVRTVGLAATVGGLYLVDEYDEGAGLSLAIVGGAVYAVGLYWDLFDAHRAARRANRRAAPRLTLSPTIGPGPSLELAGSF